MSNNINIGEPTLSPPFLPLSLPPFLPLLYPLPHSCVHSHTHTHTHQVLGLGGRDEAVTYAILQPVTSLQATLAHIKPTKGIKLQELLRREGRPPCRASVGLGCHGDVEGGVATVAASELEIHANLSLLFPRQPQTTSLTESEKGFTLVLVTGTRGHACSTRTRTRTRTHTHTHIHTHTHTHTHTHIFLLRPLAEAH